MITGMTEVAYRMSVTEAANTIDLTRLLSSGLETVAAVIDSPRRLIPAPCGGDRSYLLPMWRSPPL